MAEFNYDKAGERNAVWKQRFNSKQNCITFIVMGTFLLIFGIISMTVIVNKVPDSMEKIFWYLGLIVICISIAIIAGSVGYLFWYRHKKVKTGAK